MHTTKDVRCIHVPVEVGNHATDQAFAVRGLEPTKNVLDDFRPILSREFSRAPDRKGGTASRHSEVLAVPHSAVVAAIEKMARRTGKGTRIPAPCKTVLLD